MWVAITTSGVMGGNGCQSSVVGKNLKSGKFVGAVREPPAKKIFTRIDRINRMFRRSGSRTVRYQRYIHRMAEHPPTIIPPILGVRF